MSEVFEAQRPSLIKARSEAHNWHAREVFSSWYDEQQKSGRKKVRWFMSRQRKNRVVADDLELVREMYGEDVYEYYPLGKYVVAARGVCGGRPTLKYTRMDARWVIGYLKLGRTAEDLAAAHSVPVAAIHEVVKLQSAYDYEKSYI